MTEQNNQQDIYTLALHFDNFQGKHEISSDSLLIFLESYQKIAECFGLETEIQIGVPKNGGWETNLFLTVISYVGINFVSALVTGETLDDWGKIGHKKIRALINKFITQPAQDTPSEIPRECLKAKNKMYRQFEKDDCIDTFHLGDFSPIPRSSFHLYIADIKDDDCCEYLGETEITVNSPDWDEGGSWQGKIKIIDRKRNFSLDKDLTGKFWEFSRLSKLKPTTGDDVMKVQLIQCSLKKPPFSVIRVLSYNGQEIDLPLSDDEIAKLTSVRLDKINNQKENKVQMDLFN